MKQKLQLVSFKNFDNCLIKILDSQFSENFMLIISQEIAYTTITVRTSRRSIMTGMVILVTVRIITMQDFGMIHLVMLIRMDCMGTKMTAALVMFIGKTSAIGMH